MNDIKYLLITDDIIDACWQHFQSKPLVYIKYSTRDFRPWCEIHTWSDRKNCRRFLYSDYPIIGVSNYDTNNYLCYFRPDFIWHDDNKIIHGFSAPYENHLFMRFEKLTIEIFTIIHTFDQHLTQDVSGYIKKLYIKLIQ